MGLFKSLFKKPKEKAPSPQTNGFPELYTGMKVEVMTPANALLFLGKLRVLRNGDFLEVHGGEGVYLPRAVYNQPVRLRVFQRTGQAYTLKGTISQNNRSFWRIENLKTLQSDESRNFFRQNTTVDGWVYPITSSKGQRFSCSVLDLSAGGARVLTSKLIELGGNFRLEAAFLDDQPPITVTCQVTRILVRSRSGNPSRKYEYGCQFVNLLPRDEEHIQKAVFAIQRKVLHSQRE